MKGLQNIFMSYAKRACGGVKQCIEAALLLSIQEET